VVDYTAKPDHRYTYRVVALTGSPGQLIPVEEVSVAVRTEGHRLGAHTIVFNRGATPSLSGQAVTARKTFAVNDTWAQRWYQPNSARDKERHLFAGT
jgi:hypothetical protein